jgi:nicotinate-nucleotide adenylyltransferase
MRGNCDHAGAAGTRYHGLMEQLTTGGRRIAFFGGSFDPPHRGHLGVARAAQAALGLDTVLFAPVGTQPLKPQGSTASFEDRLAMTRLAVDAEPGFVVTLADAPKASGKPNYTLETLLALRAEFGPQSTLFCLMGADSFAGFRYWHRAAEIPFAAPLIIASRPGELFDGLESALPKGLVLENMAMAEGAVPKAEVCTYLLRNQAGGSVPFYLLPGLDIAISASEIREQMRARRQAADGGLRPERALLPAPVSDYILAHGLYR